MKLQVHDRTGPQVPAAQRYVAVLDLEDFHEGAMRRYFHGPPSETKLLALYRLLYVIVSLAPKGAWEFAAPVLAQLKEMERDHRWPAPW